MTLKIVCLLTEAQFTAIWYPRSWSNNDYAPYCWFYFMLNLWIFLYGAELEGQELQQMEGLGKHSVYCWDLLAWMDPEELELSKGMNAAGSSSPSTVRSTNPHLSSSKTAKGTRMSESLCWQHLRFTPGFAGPIIYRIASWGNMRLCTIFSWEVSWVLQHPGTLLSNGPRWERCPS